MDLDLSDRTVMALPKKGRLATHALSLLSSADIQFRREARLDIVLVRNHALALIFLPASEIPTFVGEGRCDLGITGRDQVAEHDARLEEEEEEDGEEEEGGEVNEGVEEVMDLGFGGCRLQVQVPVKGGVGDVGGLVGRKVATSFRGVTRKFFGGLEVEGGVVNGDGEGEGKGRRGKGGKTRIKEVGGSVETCCKMGVADGIVDLVGMFVLFLPHADQHSFLSLLLRLPYPGDFLIG